MAHSQAGMVVGVGLGVQPSPGTEHGDLGEVFGVLLVGGPQAAADDGEDHERPASPRASESEEGLADVARVSPHRTRPRGTAWRSGEGGPYRSGCLGRW